MPRILNRRPPTYHKANQSKGSFLTRASTSTLAAQTHSSTLSRSQRSYALGLVSPVPSVQTSTTTNTTTSRSLSSSSQVTFDASMSNAVYDQESGRLQNNDYGFFVDFYDPTSRDEDISPLWR